MKNIIIVFIVLFIYAISSSCEKMFGDYLDKAPGVDVTQDTIFSNKAESEKALAAAYQYCGFTHWNPTSTSDGELPNTVGDQHILDNCTEIGETVAPWFWPNTSYNTGNLTSTGNTDAFYTRRWMGIRKVNIYLENIDKVPRLTEAYLMRVKAEAHFLRALAYFEGWIRFGGLPIIDHSFTLTENWMIPRSTLQETMDFILADIEIAIADLPTSYIPTETGHATKLAALALKARLLLYAASPLWNTGSPPLELTGHNDLICFGSYDPNKWQVAADAQKAVLDNAADAGAALITDKGVTENYRFQWENSDNPEVIYAFSNADNNSMWYFFPQSLGGLQGNTATFNFQKYYEKKDGTPQTWNMLGGNDLLQKYDELDPRLYQTIITQNRDWNTYFPKMQMTTEPRGRDAGGCYGGAWFQKPVPREMRQAWNARQKKYPIFKLNEFYLNYAEALNEASATPPQAAYDAVNTIRARSGMPDFPAGMSKEEFRTKLRNEITIELVYEDRHLFNIRRWLTAMNDGVGNGNMYGIKIYPLPSPSTEYRYEPYVFEVRVWYPKMYHNPWPQSEIDKGYIIQNPGY